MKLRENLIVKENSESEAAVKGQSLTYGIFMTCRGLPLVVHGRNVNYSFNKWV